MKFTEPVLEIINFEEDVIICSSCGGLDPSGAVITEIL